MTDGQRKIREVVEKLREHGWRVTGDTGRHFKVYPPDKKFHHVAMASSPSDHRAILNIRAQLRRAGAWFL